MEFLRELGLEQLAEPRVLAVLGVIVAAYVLSSLGISRLEKSRRVAGRELKFAQWGIIVLLIYVLDAFVPESAKGEGLVKALVVAKVLGWWLFAKHFIDGFVGSIYLGKIKKRPVDHILLDVIKLVILMVLCLAGLKSLLNVDPGSIVTSSAILTAVIGLSMQDTIGSLISGLLIQVEKPFKLGDWISVAGLEGRVVAISWRYTKIETQDRNFVIITNNAMAKDNLVNYNAPIAQVRRRVEIGVHYDVPPVKVKAALMAVALRNPKVLKNPPPRVFLAGYGDSAINYQLFYFIEDLALHRDVVDELYSSIWYQFKQEGIEIPYPMRNIINRETGAAGSNQAIIGVLRGIPLFEGMGDEDLGILVNSSLVKVFAPGFKLVSAGAHDATLYVVLDGEVAVNKGGHDLARLGMGSFFGEMSLLTGEPRSADVITTEATRCLIVDREGFKVLLEKSPLVLRNVNEMFRKRSQEGERLSPGREAAGDSEKGLFQRFMKIFM